MHHFEAFSLAVARIIDQTQLPEVEAITQTLKPKLHAAKNDPRLRDHTVGGGKNSPGPYRAKIEFVEHILRG